MSVSTTSPSLLDSYPEHSKVQQLGGANVIVGRFLEWLEEQGYTICEDVPEGRARLRPVNKSIEQIMFDHFEIDRDKFHAEKDAMLDEIANMQERAS